MYTMPQGYKNHCNKRYNYILVLCSLLGVIHICNATSPSSSVIAKNLRLYETNNEQQRRRRRHTLPYDDNIEAASTPRKRIETEKGVSPLSLSKRQPEIKNEKRIIKATQFASVFPPRGGAYDFTFFGGSRGSDDDNSNNNEDDDDGVDGSENKNSNSSNNDTPENNNHDTMAAAETQEEKLSDEIVDEKKGNNESETEGLEEEDPKSTLLATMTSIFSTNTATKAKSFVASLPSATSSKFSATSFSSVFRMNMEAKVEASSSFSTSSLEEEDSEYDDESEQDEEEEEDVGIVMMTLNKKKKKAAPSSVEKHRRGGGGGVMMMKLEGQVEKKKKKKDEEVENAVDVTVTPVIADDNEEGKQEKEEGMNEKNEKTRKEYGENNDEEKSKVVSDDVNAITAIASKEEVDEVEKLEAEEKKTLSKEEAAEAIVIEKDVPDVEEEVKSPKKKKSPSKEKTRKKKRVEADAIASSDETISIQDSANTTAVINDDDADDKASKKRKTVKKRVKESEQDVDDMEKNAIATQNATTAVVKETQQTLTNNTATSNVKNETLDGVDDATETIELVDGEGVTKEVVVKTQDDKKQMVVMEVTTSYVSSGYWTTIDKVASLGLSSHHPNLRLSRQLRSVRKAAAKATGLHGVLSGKGKTWGDVGNSNVPNIQHHDRSPLNEEDIGIIRRRMAAIEVAKGKISSRTPLVEEPVEGAATTPARGRVQRQQRRRGWGRILRRRRNMNRNSREIVAASVSSKAAEVDLTAQSLEEEIEKARMAAAAVEEELRRQKRVEEIDRLIHQGQEELHELQCEKDDLQRRPNPLFNYTTKAPSASSSSSSSASSTSSEETTEYPSAPRTTRVFNFPPQEVVDEYIDTLISTGRLVRLNHTHLWKSGAGEYDDEEDEIGDDLLTPSADARKLYENVEEIAEKVKKRTTKRNGNKNNNGKEKKNSNGGSGGGGSWLLRQTMMTGTSLGEKIGEATETAAYKAVCSAIMSILARSISALHGVNVMTHSDIRLFLEQSPDLPPLGKGVLPHGVNDDDDYAREAIEKAIIKGATKRKKKHSRSKQHHHHSHSRHHGHDLSEEAFIQRDAVVETLISHCQISAPLLKLFPLAWQRAMLGNIITLIAAVVSDFAEGVQVQILGHQLSFAFKPITESDMIQHIGLGGFRFNHRRARPEEFEAAVRATADDISEELQFLDRWHERAMGGRLLKLQIGNLIARVVLTLVDEVLSGARMDLWSAQAGGPRVVAGLEYRTQRNEESATGLPQ